MDFIMILALGFLTILLLIGMWVTRLSLRAVGFVLSLIIAGLGLGLLLMRTLLG